MLSRKFPTLLAALSLGLAATLHPAIAADTSLEQVVQARSSEDRARDSARHPVETLGLFRVEPGMTVAEALPGGGWYTRILAPYLGSEGTLYGINYVDRMWPLFSFATDEWVEKQIASSAGFKKQANSYTESSIKAKGFTFGTVPPEAQGQVDRVLLIRALHNLARFESEAGTLSQALAAVRAMLKPGGMVGVVQHRAPATASDDWADGSHGYLKQAQVISLFEKAGFTLLDSSEINANPKDQPSGDDIVWRLPPSYAGTADDPEKRAAVDAIGESDRMTLLFQKPLSDSSGSDTPKR